jgi:hypothetical protein
MTKNKNDIYFEIVNAWEKKKANGLSPGEKASLLESALQVTIERAMQTLSGVTLMVVLDRVLHQSIDKFSILSEVKIENNKFNFIELMANEKNHGPEEILEALRYLLIELLRVLGRITADILTAPLHKELLKMAWQKPEEK